MESMQCDMEKIFAGGRIYIPEDLQVFRGHFPGQAIVPGVYSVQMAIRCMELRLKRALRLRKITRCKFHRPIFPAMQLVSEIKIISDRESDCKAKVTFLSEKGERMAEVGLELVDSSR